jgi:hypothetical protein
MESSRSQRQFPAAILGAALLAAGCSVELPVLLPPPFNHGPQTTGQPTLFFPTGIAIAPSGHLLVANSNLDQTFDSGTLLSFDPAFVNSLFAGDPNSLPITNVLPTFPTVKAALVPGYSGPLLVDQTGTTVWTASRNTNLLTALSLDPATGDLSCTLGGGTDCRIGGLDTLNAITPQGIGTGPGPILLEGPYGLTAGNANVPGGPSERVVFVGSMSPHVDDIIDSQLQTFGRLAAVLESDPHTVLFSIDVSNPTFLNGIGSGPILFDSNRQKVILGGCFQRFTSASAAGEASTAKCSAGGLNPVRFVDVTAGNQGQVTFFDLAATVHGNETTALVLGGEDASGVPQILYTLSRNPDVLVEILLPSLPGQVPVLRRAVSLPVSPSGAIRLARPPGQTGPDLLALVSSLNGAVAIYDAGVGQVVSQVNGLGDYPFEIVQLPPSGDRARLAVTVFGQCRLAFLDVSYADPADSRLRALLGNCQ